MSQAPATAPCRPGPTFRECLRPPPQKSSLEGSHKAAYNAGSAGQRRLLHDPARCSDGLHNTPFRQAHPSSLRVTAVSPPLREAV